MKNTPGRKGGLGRVCVLLLTSLPYLCYLAQTSSAGCSRAPRAPRLDLPVEPRHRVGAAGAHPLELAVDLVRCERHV